MKYLFVVNSNITALSAKAVIAHEKLPHKDIVVLTMRGATVKGLDVKHIDFIYPHIVNPIPQTRNIFKCWRVLKEFDAFIEKITCGDKFYSFVNHNMARNTELMINHKNCVGFSILEEGTAAYFSKQYFAKLHPRRHASIWDYLGYRNRIKRRYFYRPDYDKVYAVTEKAFPGFRNKVILKDFFNSLNNGVYKHLDNSKIIVFDGAVTFEMIDIHSFFAGFDKFISIASEQINGNIYFKFHPAQLDNEKEQFLKFLSNYKHIKFMQLYDDIILEEVIAIAKNLTLYFNVSTISIYANALGHKCFSYSDILCSISDNYKNRIQDLNDTLKSSSIQIKPKI